MNLEKKVTFLTSSMGTKWQSYSQALLRLNFPECKRILVDGSKRWDPLFFVKESKKVQTDYQVLVDEDCFILDREQLVHLIKIMDENQTIAVMASPDGGTFHRDYNPVACNPFFAIVRQKSLINAISRPGWEKLSYQDIEHMADKHHLLGLDLSRVSYVKKEPYYPFFWAVISSGAVISYVLPTVRRDILASEIMLDGFNRPFLIHMWWLRRWFSQEQDGYLKMSNAERYQRLEQEILVPTFRGFYRGMLLLAEKFRRKQDWVKRLISEKNSHG